MNFIQHGALYPFVTTDLVQVMYLIDTCNFHVILAQSELLKKWKTKSLIPNQRSVVRVT